MSGCVERISDNPEAFVLNCNGHKTQKNRETMSCHHVLHTEASKDCVFESDNLKITHMLIHFNSFSLSIQKHKKSSVKVQIVIFKGSTGKSIS